MKAPAVFIAVAVLVAAPASARTAARASSAQAARCRFASLPPAAPKFQLAQYGHIKSLARTGRAYRLRFDPALWLTGMTAAQAARRDTGARDVANDYYVRDETHRLLTYRVPAAAHVTVLSAKLCATHVSVAELARIVENPDRPSLYDRGGHLGFWIRTDSDTVRSLDQQYQP